MCLFLLILYLCTPENETNFDGNGHDQVKIKSTI